MLFVNVPDLQMTMPSLSVVSWKILITPIYYSRVLPDIYSVALQWTAFASITTRGTLTPGLYYSKEWDADRPKHMQMSKSEIGQRGVGWELNAPKYHEV